MKKNNAILIYYCCLASLFIFSCNNKKESTINIEITPYSFDLFCSKNELDESMRKQGVEMQYEDSHIGSDKGIYFNYFGSRVNEVDYYIELYSKDGKLKGLKAVLYSTKLPDSIFFKTLEKSILPNLKYNVINRDILFDTLREQKAPITERYQYTIYIRTKEINDIMKASQ